jgi:predicted transposase YbfD/YdcC
VAQEVALKASHGRYETRTLWAISSTALDAYVGSSGTVGGPWPGVAQVCRIQRVVRERDRKSGTLETTVEVNYAITSLGRGRADAAALMRRWRVHWHIENGLHWVRDVTFGEDSSQIHKGQAPEVFTLLRNAAVSLLSSAQAPSIAAAVRDLGSRPAAVTKFFQDLACSVNSATQPIPPPTHHSPKLATAR